MKEALLKYREGIKTKIPPHKNKPMPIWLLLTQETLNLVLE